MMMRDDVGEDDYDVFDGCENKKRNPISKVFQMLASCSNVSKCKLAEIML